LSENLYDYAENNPILNVDPTGHGNVAGWLPNIGWCYSGNFNVANIDFSSWVDVGGINNLPQNLEGFIQKQSPALNWIEAAIGRTLITNEGLSNAQRQESINKGLGALGKGMLSLGIEGGGEDGISEEVPPGISGYEGAGEAETAVIGKMADLTKPEAIQPGEYPVVDLLPDMGSPQANWQQNASVLRQIMSKGNPIRDASIDPDTGALVNNTGFLRAERKLLADHGWTYSPNTGYWSPPTQ
jgi:hypothetical protein